MNLINDYPWLKKPWLSFLNLYQEQRIPHAILINGIEGLGKEAFVKNAEQLLLCEKPHEKACGLCHACHLYQQNTHPDYRQLGSDEPISIDEIREIGDFFNQTAHIGRRIVTLHQVDKLQPNAANALLKNLEEPSSDLIFLLVAEKTSGVLPTIQSRAIKLPIGVPVKELSLAWLKEKHPQKSKTELEWSLILSGGGPLKADFILAKDALSLHKLLVEIVFFKKIEILYQKEMQQYISTQSLEVLNGLYYLLTQFAYYLGSQEKNVMLNLIGSEKLKSITDKFSLKEILFYIEEINKAMQEFSLPGINKSLILEALFFKI